MSLLDERAESTYTTIPFSLHVDCLGKHYGRSILIDMEKMMIKQIIDTKIQGLMEDNVAHDALSFKMNSVTMNQFALELRRSESGFGYKLPMPVLLSENNSETAAEFIKRYHNEKKNGLWDGVIVYNGFQVEVDNSLADGAVWTTVSGSVGE